MIYKDIETGHLFSTLTKENFLLFAVKNYKNCHCSGIDDFYEDLERLKTIQRLLSRYDNNEEMNEQLLLNNIITFFNVFDMDAAKMMLIHKVKQCHWRIIKTFMVFLGYINPRTELKEIEIIPELLKKLEKEI